MSKTSLYILLAIIVFSGCQTTANPFLGIAGEQQVYLFNDETVSLEPINLYLKDIIDIHDTNQVLHYVLQMLSEGATSSNLKPTLQKDIQLDYFVINEGNLLLNFDENYLKMNTFDELIARNSIVLSLTSFDMIRSVEIFVDEKTLMDTMGNRIGPKTKADVLTSMYASANTSLSKTITLYYPIKNKRFLEKKTASITLHPNKHQEELIVEYLLSDPRLNFLSEDIQVLDVQVHENICYVNFNEQFITSYLPEGISTTSAIYAIVNTLTELNHISRVQILVEGEVVETYQGTFPLKTPLAKNYEMIQE